MHRDKKGRFSKKVYAENFFDNYYEKQLEKTWIFGVFWGFSFAVIFLFILYMAS